ncbi:MAG: hypothetical protein DI570_02910 [Phenylobacterium zucineum]|nr:MAG: hypothetical protein DI570_02910 [Phenylobacterium zucineum]
MPTSDFISAAESGRWDIYGPIHKGLRLAHGELLRRLGRADFDAGVEAGLLADLRTHLELASKHLAHEEGVIHPALEARTPGATGRLDADHAHHQARFAMLEGAVRAVEHAAAAARPALGRALYIAFSAFVAEDLTHMAREETETWPQLCAVLSDEEIAGLEMTIISSLSEADNIAFMRMMLPAMNPAERTALLTAMKSGAPPEAYAAVIDLAARPALPPEDFAHLRTLGLAA